MKFKFDDYCETSTIHGLKYLSNKFHWIKRLFWIISLCLSLVLTVVLIVKLIIKITSIPVVIFQSSQKFPVTEINFPSVTFCRGFNFALNTPTHRTNAKIFFTRRHDFEIYNYEPEEFSRATSDERMLINQTYIGILEKIENGEINPASLGLRILKRLQVVDLITKRGTFAKKNFSIPTHDFLDVINEFDHQHRTNEGIIRFIWGEMSRPLSSEIITEHGICMSFNNAFSNETFDTHVVSNDFHYKIFKYSKTDEIINDYIPRHTIPIANELRINARSREGTFKRVPNFNFNGYLIWLQDPYEYPSRLSHQTTTQSNDLVRIIVEPQMISVDESLYDDDPIDRNCNFSNERKLKHFRVYTKNNCEQECLTDYMIKQCGCVEFFMVRNFTTRICSANEKNCFDNARNEFDRYFHEKCRCLHPCNYIKYNIESERNIISYKYQESLIDDKETSISVEYKEDYFFEIIHKKQFNEVDFLSYVGGLLGLFAGFSALSFVELIYWFVLKSIMKIFKKSSQRVYPQIMNIRVRKNNKKIVSEYFKESSIHGFNYLIDSNQFGRVFWSYSVIISLTLCGFMMYGINDLISDSFVIKYDNELNFNGNVEFPSVTFLTDYYVPSETFLTEDEMDLYYALNYNNKILSNQFKYPKIYEYALKLTVCTMMDSAFNDFYKDNNYRKGIVNFYHEILESDNFKEHTAVWNNIYAPKFAKVVTERGFGLSFNMIDSDKLFHLNEVPKVFHYFTNITLRNDHNLIELNKSYPLRSNIYTPTELTFKFFNNKTIPENHVPCFSSSFKIHSPYEIPLFTSRKDFHGLENGMIMNVEIIPEVTKTDDDLRKLSPGVRECYFADEKKLKFYKIYTKQNCLLDCITRKVSEYCDCHHENGSKICRNDNDLNCPVLYKKRLFADGTMKKDCLCYPLCNSLNYHVKYYSSIGADNETIVNIRMNTDDVILYRRYQQFTFSDAVSYVGGLLGLFAGISMLSIVEIIYFFILRFFVNLYRAFKLN